VSGLRAWLASLAPLVLSSRRRSKRRHALVSKAEIGDEMGRLPYEMVKPPHSHQIGGNLSRIDTITARPSYASTRGASVFEYLASRRDSCRTKVQFAQLSVSMYYLYVNVNSKVVGLPQQATSRRSG
jgi:hypothetical protein